MSDIHHGTRRGACIALSAALISAPAMSRAFLDDALVDPDRARTAVATATNMSAPIAPDPPEQVRLDEVFSVNWRGFSVEATHGFAVEAVVLARQDYEAGDVAELVPVDLALAWGKVSSPDWIRHLRVEQETRIYRWSFPAGVPLDEAVVARESANMHFMPATRDIRRRLEDVREGDLVRFSGYLVDISGPEGFSWKSSRVRTDSGKGACEIILLEELRIIRG